jgi:uncharacterized membrane protein
MEKLTNLKWRPIYTAYAIVLLSITGLFFIGRYEAGFSAFMHDDPKDDMLPGLTLNKIVLFILNLGLLTIIGTPLKIEDERVEKIRNFAMKQTFIMGTVSAAGLGLLMSGNFSPLIYTLAVQCYYLLLFELCLYRDSRIVYLTVAEQQANVKASKKKLIIYTSVQGVVMGIVSTIIIQQYRQPNLFWISQAVLAGTVVLVVTVYKSWKR